MKAINKYLTIFLIVLAIISGCDDDIKGPGDEIPDPRIRGMVIDSAGNAVANVSITLFFDPCLFGAACRPSLQSGTTEPITNSKLLKLSSGNDELIRPYPNPFDSSTDIEFIIEDTTKVKIWITEFCAEDTLEVLVDKISTPGVYHSRWTISDSIGYKYNSGGYYVNMTTDNYSERILAIIINFEGDAISDVDGSFFIDQECLPFGSQYFRTGVSSPDILEIVDITRYIGLWVSSPIYNTVIVDSVFVDSLTGADVTIQFEG